MRGVVALLALAAWSMAGPAWAQQNPFGLDYIEASTTTTPPAGQALMNYELDTGSGTQGLAMSQFALAYGLTESLTVATSLNLAGPALGFHSAIAGVAFAPPVQLFGWSPGLQAHYAGGPEPSWVGRGVLSLDVPESPLLGGERDRLNMAVNVVMERELFGDRRQHLGYALAASYPIIGADTPPEEGLRGLQRQASRLRLGLEFDGDLFPGGSHFVMPGVYANLTDTLQVAGGLGFRIAGSDGDVAFTRLNIQSGF